MTSVFEQVGPYTRFDQYGRPYDVQGYVRTRKKRPLGTRVEYEDMGRVQYGRDNQDNLRGTRVMEGRLPKESEASFAERRAAKTRIDSDYLLGKVTREEWKKMRS